MKQLIVYDDFYSDPTALRAIALDTEFEESSSGNYPGKNSKLQHFPNEFKDFFSWLAGEPLKPSAGSHCGGFRIQNANETGKQFIHVDLPSMETTWAAICYLSLPEHYTNEDGTVKDAGSKFWKHKETGMEQMPRDVEYLASIGINGPQDLKVFMDTQGTDPSKWFNTFSVPIKFNRLILFKANLWHSQGELFGDNKENGRLIQTFFFEPDVQFAQQPAQQVQQEGWKKVEN